MKNLLIVALGGSLGAVSRYMISKQINNLYPLSNVPLGTLSVNMIGAYIIGILFGIITYYNVNVDLKLFIMVGFLGALTTYSAYSVETIELFKSNVNSALLNIALNNIGCLLMVIAGSFTFKILLKFLK